MANVIFSPAGRTSGGTLPHRLLPSSLLLVVLYVSFAAGSAHAQCTLGGTLSTWNIMGNGTWSTGGDWNPAGSPNSASTNVCITNGTSTVTLDISASMASLQLASGNTLNINNNLSTTVSGPSIINAGAITLNGGAGANGFLNIAGSVALSGAGTLTLNDQVGSGEAFIQGNSQTLTNNSTIRGTGVIGNGSLAVINGGIINANDPTGKGSLTLSGTGGVNNSNGGTPGLLEASSGGTLVINSITVNNASANITAGAGSAVDLVNATIQGGTLNNSGGGTLQTLAGFAATLDGSTQAVTLSNNSVYTASNNTSTNLLGTINLNTGSNLVLNGGGGANGFLNISGVTLNGGGTLTMSDATGGGEAFIQGNSQTLTNNSTIRGTGVIGNGSLAVVNGGIINANDPTGKGSLTLSGTGGVNNSNGGTPGLLEASSGGTLVINSITVNNASANITAGAGSAVDLVNATIQGGTLNNSAGGTLQTLAGFAATLDGSTQAVTLSNNSVYTASNNTSTNLLGTINLNTGSNLVLNGGNGANGYLNISSSNVTLNGPGTLTMNDIPGSGEAFIQGNGNTLTTGANVSIVGAGVIGNGTLAVVNGGTINANVAASASSKGVLTLNGTGGLTNSGLLEASNNGVLSIANGTINNTNNSIAGTIQANGAGSTVQFVSGAVINGGNLEGNGTIAVASAGTVMLNGGRLTPGFSGLGTPATLTLTGNLNQTVGSYNELFSATGNGLLKVSGLVTLGSGPTLTLGPLNGFNVVLSTPIDILNYGTLSGQFSNGTAITADGYNWSIFYNFNSMNEVVLEAISKVAPTDVTATWSTVSGNWNIPTEWACAPGPPNCDPNNNANTVYETVVNSPGNMLTLDNSGGPITVNTLALQTGTLDIASGASLNLVNQPNGITNIPSGASLTVAGTFVVNGTTNALAQLSSVGGTLTLVGQTTNISNALTNSGIVNAQQGTTLSVNGNLTNSGTVNVQSSTVSTGAFSNSPGAEVNVLGGGTLTVSGGFTNGSGVTVTDGVMNVTSGGFTNTGTLNMNSVVGGSASVTGGFANSGGAVLLNGKGDMLNAASFTNSGAVIVGANESLNVVGSYTQTGGSTDVYGNLNANSYMQSGGGTKIELGGTITAPTFTVTGGSVQGTGTIAGAVTMGGTITAGFGPSTPGTLNINGSYHQTSGGVYSELISSATNGGLLNVSGNTALDTGAALTITLLGAFLPTNGTSYTILDYGSGSTENGTFTITNPTFNGGTQQWVITSYNGGDGDDIILTAEAVNTAPTPEPGSLLLLGTGLLGLGGLLQRKRSAKTH